MRQGVDAWPETETDIWREKRGYACSPLSFFSLSLFSPFHVYVCECFRHYVCVLFLSACFIFLFVAIHLKVIINSFIILGIFNYHCYYPYCRPYHHNNCFSLRSPTSFLKRSRWMNKNMNKRQAKKRPAIYLELYLSIVSNKHNNLFFYDSNDNKSNFDSARTFGVTERVGAAAV